MKRKEAIPVVATMVTKSMPTIQLTARNSMNVQKALMLMAHRLVQPTQNVQIQWEAINATVLLLSGSLMMLQLNLPAKIETNVPMKVTLAKPIPNVVIRMKVTIVIVSMALNELTVVTPVHAQILTNARMRVTTHVVTTLCAQMLTAVTTANVPRDLKIGMELVKIFLNVPTPL
jgi:hypothetical protein